MGACAGLLAWLSLCTNSLPPSIDFCRCAVVLRRPQSADVCHALGPWRRYLDGLQGVPPGQLEVLGSLRKLAILSLANCRLAALPAALASLPRLRTLFLHGNELDEALEAPAWLGQLTKLSLYLGALCRWMNGLPAAARLKRLYIMRCGAEEEEHCGGLSDALQLLPRLRRICYVLPREAWIHESVGIWNQMLALSAAPGLSVQVTTLGEVDWE